MKHQFKRILDNYKEWDRALFAGTEKSQRHLQQNFQKEEKRKGKLQTSI
jgi:hypothetical protein